MPRILKNIDKIALEKQRDVLYIMFHKAYINSYDDYFTFDYEHFEQRNLLMTWLNQQNINFYDCFGFPSNNGIISRPYLGEIYLDVPFDETDSQYKILYEHLKNTDGSMKIQDVVWYYYPLSKAIENKVKYAVSDI